MGIGVIPARDPRIFSLTGPKARVLMVVSAEVAAPAAAVGGKGDGGGRKRGYSVNLAILLGVAMFGVLSPAGDAFANCQWFKVCGFPPLRELRFRVPLQSQT